MESRASGTGAQTAIVVAAGGGTRAKKMEQADRGLCQGGRESSLPAGGFPLPREAPAQKLLSGTKKQRAADRGRRPRRPCPRPSSSSLHQNRSRRSMAVPANARSRGRNVKTLCALCASTTQVAKRRAARRMSMVRPHAPPHPPPTPHLEFIKEGNAAHPGQCRGKRVDLTVDQLRACMRSCAGGWRFRASGSQFALLAAATTPPAISPSVVPAIRPDRARIRPAAADTAAAGMSVDIAKSHEMMPDRMVGK